MQGKVKEMESGSGKGLEQGTREREWTKGKVSNHHQWMKWKLQRYFAEQSAITTWFDCEIIDKIKWLFDRSIIGLKVI